MEQLEDRLLLAGDLVISEFMAVNDSTLADAEGEFRDWLEIHNISDNDVDLEGWHLTDDPLELDRWTFPAVSLDSDEYLIVFASGKDWTDPAEELHTDFKIGSTDEILALVRPDGTTIEHQYDLTTITSVADVSYGILPDGQAGYFMTQPTPGEPNIRLVAEAAQYSTPGGTFGDSFELILSANSPTAAIHYTTNGTTPTAASAVYTTPLTISATTRVRTLVTEVGMVDGPVTSETYIAIAADVQSFNSNLPVVVLDTHGRGINDSNYTFASAVFIDTAEDGGRASILGESNYAGRTGLKIRGSSSSAFPKKQYKLETWDETNEDDSAALLGMPSESDWVLYAPYSDKTLMRNYLVYKWYAEMGNYSVRTRFCEVYLNTGAGAVTAADYVGVYVLTEKVKADDDRVDIDRMTPDDNAAPEVTGGYILEGVNSSRAEGTLNVDHFRHSNMYLNYIEPRPEDISPAQKTYIANYLNSARSSMANSSYDQWLVPESFADYDIVQQLTLNQDSWYGSVFMFKPREGRLQMGPMWDFNLGMGNINYGVGDNLVGWAYSHSEFPWYSRLATNPAFNQLWADRWGQFRQDVFSLDSMHADIDEAADLLDEAQIRDQARWNTLGTYVWPNADGFASRTTYQSEIDYLKDWLTSRVGWIDSQYTQMPSYNQGGPVVPDGFELTIDVPTGTAYYTTDGSDPRASGGGIAASASAYSPGMHFPAPLLSAGATWKYLDTNIKPDSEWITAAFDDGAWSSGAAPLGYGGAQATTVSYGPNASSKYITTWFRKTFNLAGGLGLGGLTLRLKVDDGAVAYLNGHEIARTNMPDDDIKKGTLATADAADDGTTWQAFYVPAGWLADGDNVLAVEVHQVAADSDDLAFDAELDMLLVTTPSSTPIVINQTTQIITRIRSGSNWSAPIETMLVPETMPTLRITELNYHPYAPSAAEAAAGFTTSDFEFIELVNVGDQPISTLGLAFGDGIEYAFGETTIAAGGRILLAANQAAFQMRSGFFPLAGIYDGSLNDDGETVALVDATGRALQEFTYNDSKSWPGRADGKGASLEVLDTAGDYDDPDNWQSSGEYGGSPYWDGFGMIGDVVVNEVLTHTDLPMTDSIELHNTTGDPIDVSGWYLSDNSDDYLKFRIPDGTTIPVGGYVVFNEYDFNVTGMNVNPYDDDPKDFGLNGGEGDHVWLMAATLTGKLSRFVDHVKFDAAFNGISFGRYPNATGELVSLESQTLGDPNNDDPVVGPIVISEFMYHPADAAGLDEDQLEYIELHNITGSPVPMGWYDSDGNGFQGYGEVTPWKLDGAVEFDFPSVTIPADGRLLVVDFAPTDAVKLAAFMTTYGLTGLVPGINVVGGWSGNMANNSEDIELYAFDSPPMGEVFFPQVLMDLVEYTDDAPWPVSADGTGDSLQRDGAAFGNDPANWTAGAPTPGSAPSSGMAADFDGDGDVDLDDFVLMKQNFLTFSSIGDADGNGFVDLDDFVILKQTFLTGAAAAPVAASVAIEAIGADMTATVEPVAPVLTARAARRRLRQSTALADRPNRLALRRLLRSGIGDGDETVDLLALSPALLPGMK